VVLMAADPLDEVLRLVADGRLTADEAAPILAALDERMPGAEPAGPGAPTGARSEPPGGFGANPPPSAPRAGSSGAEGDGPRTLRIEVTDAGRPVVNLRLPIAVGKLALDRIPGLPAEHVSRVREALLSGYRGTVLEVDDDGDGVRIWLE
jgi:hypothetical protein